MGLFKHSFIRKLIVPLVACAILLLVPESAAAAIPGSQGVKTKSLTLEPDPRLAAGLPKGYKCLVCHALPKLKNDKVYKSIYFSPDDVSKWAHGSVGCVGCHSNYTTKPDESHEAISERDNTKYVDIARASCTRCHSHDSDIREVAMSVHGGEPSLQADTEQPTCLDCHDHHDLRDPKKDKEWARQRQISARNICGKCHKKQLASYNDYYHGMAYKAGSRVRGQSLVKTCRQCHKTADAAFVSYAPLIHSHGPLYRKNPLVSWFVNLIMRLAPKPALNVEA
jgi:hypothetical protein